jgi:hypothetical protein
MVHGEFAQAVREALAAHLDPCDLRFRGSCAAGKSDEYSDVDLLAAVHLELDGPFYEGLERHLCGVFGPALVRYDPDYRTNTAAQDVRFSFYRLPVFWRVDLTIESDIATRSKWPSPFPEWHLGTSALMNVVWAVKYERRGDREAASRLMACACDKLGADACGYTPERVVAFVKRLSERADTDPRLAAKLIETLQD